MNNPKIYVACLASYNNGILHGTWIDLIQDIEDVHSELRQMLKSSPITGAEEWAVHDYEEFEGHGLSEYTSIETAYEIAWFVYEHGCIAGKLLQHFSGDLSEAQNAMDNHAGEYRSLADFAEEITEQTTTIPKNLMYYIDYESMGRDMEMNGDVFTIETSFEEIHIFWNG